MARVVKGASTRNHLVEQESGGPNVWNMTPPDGVIDLANDILGVILQYSHNCV